MDVDWVDNVSNRKSTNGFMFSSGSGVVNWNNKKRLNVALSNTKAKYKGATIVACEVVWLQKLFANLG
jgi:hypothetical protein